MNAMPPDWSAQMQAAYPKRSGPCGWGGMRLMLALRRALIEHTWETILNGCKTYKTYCESAGKVGSEFVQSPQRFLEDCTFLEDLHFEVPKTAAEIKNAEAKAREQVEWERLKVEGAAIGIRPNGTDTPASFRTRIMLEGDNPSNRQPRATQQGVRHAAEGAGGHLVAVSLPIGPLPSKSADPAGQFEHHERDGERLSRRTFDASALVRRLTS